MDPQISRKRRRRRRVDRPAISARLLIDERLKGEAGILSEDLFGDLFPACAADTGVYLAKAALLLQAVCLDVTVSDNETQIGCIMSP
jgi:hypothetical protein